MCQPFLPQIADGEISLIYFNKQFSHALLKVPKAGEFRVQEEFGGAIIALKPDEKLLAVGDKIISAVSDDLLYARVDLVPYENDFALMELELIEPALYFRTDVTAVDNFSKALKNVKKK
jgi:glutathione synthase/RimK-type ligase-like ATP-grasp enzyme